MSFFITISVTEAKNQLSQLIRAVEQGEEIVIARHGKAVAKLTSTPRDSRKVRFGTMRERIHVKPGWDKPLTEEQFLQTGFLLDTNVALVAAFAPEQLSRQIRVAIEAGS